MINKSTPETAGFTKNEIKYNRHPRS